MPFLNIYPASKTVHCHKWRAIDLSSKFIKISARWVKQVIIDDGDLLKQGPGTLNATMARRCWIEDEEDICRSDYLMLYAEQEEHLRGGLVEAGIAIHAKIPVIIIGEHLDYGSWQHHPGVIHVSSLDVMDAWAEYHLKERMKS